MKSWVISLFVSSVITAIACEISPKGRTHSVVKLACGLMMILCLLAPLGAKTADGFGIESFTEQKERIRGKIAADEKEATRKVIQERFEAYIIDKGKNFGIPDLDARVTLRWSSEGYWYPVSAELFSREQSALDVLCDVIRAELGIEEIIRHGS